MAAALLGLVPPLLVAWLAARACWPPAGPRAGRTVLTAALAGGLALGLGSLTWIVRATWGDPSRLGSVAAEVLFYTVVGAGLVAAGRCPDLPAAGPLPRPRPTRWVWAVYAAFGVVLVAALTTLGLALARTPHGEIDAWQIWNLHARLLFRGGDRWAEPFAHMEAWSHPDYPLLVPAAVARGWSAAGGESTWVPRLVAFLFAAATVGLLTSGLALLRTPAQGCLAGLALLATPPYLRYTAAQYADVPLGFYFLAGVLLFEARDRLRPGGLRLVVLAGLLTGMAAWTKNEGQLFVVATLAGRLVAAAGRQPPRRTARELTAFAAGLAPFLVVLAYFKLRIAATNDLVAGQKGGATLPRLLSAERLGVVVSGMVSGMARVVGGAMLVLAVYGLLLGRARVAGGRGRHTSTVLAVMLAGYTLVYMISPLHLALHIALSADRLCLQLWPCVLLLFFLNVAAPEERLAGAL